MVALLSLTALVVGGVQTPRPPVPPLAPNARLLISEVKGADRLPYRNAPNYRLVYSNEGKEALTLREAGFWPNHRVVLLDLQGKEAPLSERGKVFRDGLYDAFGNRDHNVGRRLAAGDKWSSLTRFDVDELYQLKPGRYSLVVEYYEQLNPPMWIVSNKLPYVVGAKKARS